MANSEMHALLEVERLLNGLAVVYREGLPEGFCRMPIEERLIVVRELLAIRGEIIAAIAENYSEIPIPGSCSSDSRLSPAEFFDRLHEHLAVIEEARSHSIEDAADSGYCP